MAIPQRITDYFKPTHGSQDPPPFKGNDADPPKTSETKDKPALIGSKENPMHVITDKKSRDYKNLGLLGLVSIGAGGTVVVANNMYQDHKQGKLQQEYTA